MREKEREREGERKRGERGRALPAETKVESGTSQSKSGTSLNLRNSGALATPHIVTTPARAGTGLWCRADGVTVNSASSFINLEPKVE